MKTKDIELREDNSRFYNAEIQEEIKIDQNNQSADNAFAKMAVQMEISQKQTELNPIIYYKIQSLKVPKVVKKIDQSSDKTEEKIQIAKKASGYKSNWIVDREIDEIKSCILELQSK